MCLSVEVSLVSRHIKRTCIQYNNKLRAQHLRPLLDTDCRIKTNLIKQIGPLPLAQRMHAGGAQLGLLGGGGCSLMCWVSVTVECFAQTSPSSHVSITGVCVCICGLFSVQHSPGFIQTWYRPQNHIVVVSENTPAAALNSEDLDRVLPGFIQFTGSARDLKKKKMFLQLSLK